MDPSTGIEAVILVEFPSGSWMMYGQRSWKSMQFCNSNIFAECNRTTYLPIQLTNKQIN